MPETVTISMEEYANLLMVQESADYVYGIIHHVVNSDGDLIPTREFAQSLLDEWTK